MGEYSFIHGKIRNITIDEVMNYLANRYSNMIEKQKYEDDTGILNIVPCMHLCNYNMEDDGVVLWDSVKWQNSKYAAQHAPGFFAIYDACKSLGDSTLTVDDIRLVYAESDEEREKIIKDNSIYTGEVFPPKARIPYRDYMSDPKERESARLMFFLIYDILGIDNIKNKKGVTIPDYMYPVSSYIYSVAGKFLRSKSRENLKAFYNVHQMCLQLAKEERGYDMEKLDVETFVRLLNDLPQNKMFVYYDETTQEDIMGLAKVFAYIGNMEIAKYCHDVYDTVGRFHELRNAVKDIKPSLASHIAPSPNFTVDGVDTPISITKTYGWGFRNFDDISIEVILKNDGLHISEEEKERFESKFLTMSFPHAAHVMGWYIDDDNIEEGLKKENRDDGRQFLLGHLYRIKKASIRSAFSEVIDERRLFLNRRKELAEQFWKDYGTVELNVPFKEKEEAKEAGATWDRNSKHWIMDRNDALKYAKPEWLPESFKKAYQKDYEEKKDGKQKKG